MKLGILFLVIAAFGFYFAVQMGNLWLWLLLGNCGLAFLILSAGYFLNYPAIFLKSGRGEIPLLIRWPLWPYFLLNRASYKLFRLTSRREPFNEIVPKLFLGCRLGPADKNAATGMGLSSVLDLTAEFGEIDFLRALPSYRCIPILDHRPPRSGQLREGIDFITDSLARGPVYVHCALGHSRSATFVVGYLISAGVASNIEEAIRLVQSKRPGANLHPSQRQALQEFYERRTKSG